MVPQDKFPLVCTRKQPLLCCPESEELKASESSPQRQFSITPAELCRAISAVGVSLGWLTSSFSMQAYAADLSIGNSGIQVQQNTTLRTDFVESHGAYQSTFGVINLTTKEKTPLLIETKPSDNPETIFKPSSRRSHVGTNQDFLGTPGNAVPNPTKTYTFKPNNQYAFYLESTFNGRPTGILYSTDQLNPDQERHVSFNGTINSLCQSGGMLLGWDDTGSRIVRSRPDQDRDFDDFLVRVRNTACPIGGGEPPPVVSPISPGTPVGQLPVAGAPAAGGTSSFLLPALLGAGAIAGLAIGLSGGGGSNNGGSSSGGGGTPGEPIPEPMTMMGTGAAIGIGAFLQRRRAKKRKKD